MVGKIHKSEEEWKKELTPEQFRVMRQKGTEAPYSCAWKKDKFRPGTFNCAACGLPLFKSESKFESGTGWPSYFEPAVSGNIEEYADRSLGMERTEVRCARCDSHLGHVFNDAPRLAETRRSEAGGPPPTFKRYCINSVALKFVPKQNE